MQRKEHESADDCVELISLRNHFNLNRAYKSNYARFRKGLKL